MIIFVIFYKNEEIKIKQSIFSEMKKLKLLFYYKSPFGLEMLI